jgi:hypothetical protein
MGASFSVHGKAGNTLHCHGSTEAVSVKYRVCRDASSIVMNGFKQNRSGSHSMTPMDVLTMPDAELHQGSAAHGASGTMPEQGNFFVQTVPVRMAQRAPSHPFAVGFESLNAPASWTCSDCSRYGRSLTSPSLRLGACLSCLLVLFAKSSFARHS